MASRPKSRPASDGGIDGQASGGPGRARGRLRRLARAAVAAALVALVAGAVLYRFRVAVANRLLSFAGPSIAVRVESFDLMGPGSARIRGLKVARPGGSRPLLEVAEARLRFRFDQLAARRLEAVELDAPAVDLPPALFRSPGPGPAADATGDALGRPRTGGTPPTRWRIGNLQVTDGSARVDTGDGTRLSFAFDSKGGPLEQGDEGLPFAGEQVLEIRELEGTREDQAGEVRIPRMRVRIARDRGAPLEIRELTVPEIRGQVDLAAFSTFVGKAPTNAGEGGAAALRVRDDREGAQSGVTRLPGLRVQSLEIGDLQLEVRGLPEAIPAPDSREARVVALDGSYRLNGLEISADGQLIGGTHTLEVSASAGDWLELSTLRARAETSGQRTTLRELAIGPGFAALGRLPFPHRNADGDGASSPPSADGDTGESGHGSSRDEASSPSLPASGHEIVLEEGSLHPFRLSWIGSGEVPSGTATISADLSDLALTTGDPTPRSEAAQSIRLEALSVLSSSGDPAPGGVEIHGPPAPSLVSAESIAATFVPDRVLDTGRIDSLAVDGPAIFARRDDVREWATRFGLSAGDAEASIASSGNPASAPGGAAPIAPAPTDASGVATAFDPKSLRIDRLSVTDGRLRTALVEELGLPAVAASFEASTEEGASVPVVGDDDDDAPTPSRTHRFTIRDLRATGPAGADLAAGGGRSRPIARLDELAIDVDSEAFWSRREIADVRATGLRVLAGESLLALGRSQAASDPGSLPAGSAPPDPGGDGGAQSAPAPAPAPADPGSEARAGSADPSGSGGESTDPPWTIGRLEIDESTAVVEEMVPGLPPIAFAIDTRLENIPLSRAGLAAARDVQRIEIANAAIRSRLNPLVTVAELRSIFVEFSLGGLLAREIEKVEIVSPILYVGEHLFWYVDYYRQFEAPAATTNAAEPSVQDAGSASTPPAGADDLGWDVGLIEAHSGRLVLAPKGNPLENIPPLPFSGRTRLVDGRLEFEVPAEGLPEAEERRPILALTIPKGDYPLRAFSLDWDLNLLGLTGEIAFNLPIGQRTNNLVQTLQAEELWFEQVNLSEPFLSVTYDQFGIYARFGGRAFDGYANGEFNLYLDDRYSWDGWVTGTSIDVDPLTEALTPSYCRMTGRVDCELIADGDLVSVDNLAARGSIRSRPGGGRIHTVALSDLADRLPDDLDDLRRALVEAGLEVLSRFVYDTAAVDFRASGREGRFDLQLEGPSGVRAIEVRAHDRRYRPPEVAGPPGP